MTEAQAQALAQNLASALHRLAMVESRRAVAEYRSQNEPDAAVDAEELNHESVQVCRHLENVLKDVFLGIRLDDRLQSEPGITEAIEGGRVISSYPWQKGKG